MGPGGIPKVQAAWGILKNVWGTPGRAGRVSVPTLFQEFQLELQDFKNVAICMGHGVYPAGVRGAGDLSLESTFLARSILTL
jgi:hypothetical protein